MAKIQLYYISCDQENGRFYFKNERADRLNAIAVDPENANKILVSCNVKKEFVYTLHGYDFCFKKEGKTIKWEELKPLTRAELTNIFNN